MGWIRFAPDEFVHSVNKADAMYWASALDKSPALKASLKRRADQTIAGDLFESLYDWEPKLKGDDESPNPAVAEFIRQLRQDPEFQELRDRTVGDRIRASAGAQRLYREMMRTRGGETSTLSAIADFKDRVDTFEALGDPNDPSVKSLKEIEKAMAEQFRKQGIPDMDTAMREDTKLSRPPGTPATKAEGLSDAIKGTDEAMQMTEDLTGFESDIGKGSSLGGPATERLVGELMDEGMAQSFQHTSRLKQLLKIAGRMRVVLQQEKSKKPKPAPPPIGLTTGSDMSAVLPQELALLADEDLEVLFFQRYLDAGLMSYDRKAKPKEGRGPFVALVDISGSMRGRPETMACAMFIAMAREALKKNRRALFIPFASQAGKPLDIKHAKDLFEMAGYHPKVGSGTNFPDALDTAMAEIERTGGSWKDADIVLISDGDARVSDDWVKRFKARQKATGARLIGIMVGGLSRWQEQLQDAMTTSISMKENGEMEDLEWFRRASKAVL